MAEVFLAVLRGERGFEKPIVIKVLRSGLVGQPVYAEMLVNEARLAARLNHPNIVQVIDCGTIDGRPFIAMELVAGQDLLQIASRARSL
ncbi:MAG TPA: protein kinase, partial [Polyangia bacterium]